MLLYFDIRVTKLQKIRIRCVEPPPPRASSWFCWTLFLAWLTQLLRSRLHDVEDEGAKKKILGGEHYARALQILVQRGRLDRDSLAAFMRKMQVNKKESINCAEIVTSPSTKKHVRFRVTWLLGACRTQILSKKSRIEGWYKVGSFSMVPRNPEQPYLKFWMLRGSCSYVK